MFNAAHDSSNSGIGLALAGEVELRAADSLVETHRVLQAVDVLRSVRVDVLQALRELLVETVHGANDASTDENRASFGLGRPFDHIVVLHPHVLLNDVVVVGGEDGDEFVDIALGREPHWNGKVGGGGGVVVETGGDERMEDADAVVGSIGDLEELSKDSKVFCAVRVLETEN